MKKAGTGSGQRGRPRKKAEKLDLRSTIPPYWDSNYDPHADRSNTRLWNLPSAPVYRPTVQEWTNPLGFIEKIRPEAEKYGLCKIIPPAGWEPPFAIDSEIFRFETRIQKLNSMEGSSRSLVNFLDQLEQFHQQMGTPFNRMPMLDRKPLDLLLLRKEVTSRGGFYRVSNEKKWFEVGKALGAEKNCTSASHICKQAYSKWILPFEEFVAENVTPRKSQRPGRSDSEPLAGDAAKKRKRNGDEMSYGEDFGFEDGEMRTLAQFQKMSNLFKEHWFEPKCGRNHEGRLVISEDEVEREFWRLVESPYDEVEVEYGADLHSSIHGSGFPVVEKEPLNPYSKCGWNLNNIPVLPDSLFCNIRHDISGMMIPWLYVGMIFSAFCWHTEDHYTYSINYHHWGETKTWYGVPASDAEKFELAMKRRFPELFETNPDLLFHLTTTMSPGFLKDNFVEVNALDQHAGEFVITFPRSYHAGFNHGKGVTISEDVNATMAEDLNCAICRTFLFNSAVSLPCSPGFAVCLQHADAVLQLCTCARKKIVLSTRFTLDALESFVNHTEMIAGRPQEWRKSYAALLSGQRRPHLTELQTLASNGMTIPYHLDEIVSLTAFVSEATTWAQNVYCLLARVKFSPEYRLRSGVVKLGNVASTTLAASSINLAYIAGLLSAVEFLPFLELEILEEALDDMDWIIEAETVVEEEMLDCVALEQLLLRAKPRNSPQTLSVWIRRIRDRKADLLSSLKKFRTRADRWNYDLDGFLKQKHIDYDDLIRLVNSAQSIPVDRQKLDVLTKSLENATAWIARSKSVLKFSTEGVRAIKFDVSPTEAAIRSVLAELSEPEGFSVGIEEFVALEKELRRTLTAMLKEIDKRVGHVTRIIASSNLACICGERKQDSVGAETPIIRTAAAWLSRKVPRRQVMACLEEAKALTVVPNHLGLLSALAENFLSLEHKLVQLFKDSIASKQCFPTLCRALLLSLQGLCIALDDKIMDNLKNHARNKYDIGVASNNVPEVVGGKKSPVKEVKPKYDPNRKVHQKLTDTEQTQPQISRNVQGPTRPTIAAYPLQMSSDVPGNRSSVQSPPQVAPCFLNPYPSQITNYGQLWQSGSYSPGLGFYVAPAFTYTSVFHQQQ
ncbi:hypothetical protein HDU76_013854 [Blyttiomyces sp. JEL0837]|nr:hypothetical protein HDU76_013854 [Blyttiomyces sp. JEL0837]